MLKSWSVKKFTAMLTILVLGLSFIIPSVYAKGAGKGEGRSPGPGFEPKGWDEGKKTGWNGAEKPPGLIKKDTGKHKKNKKHKHKGKEEDKKENHEAEKHETEKK